MQKEYRKAHNGEWISDKKLFEATKGIYAINSQSVQAVVQKYLAARTATKMARDKGRNTFNNGILRRRQRNHHNRQIFEKYQSLSNQRNGEIVKNDESLQEVFNTLERIESS